MVCCIGINTGTLSLLWVDRNSAQFWKVNNLRDISSTYTLIKWDNHGDGIKFNADISSSFIFTMRASYLSSNRTFLYYIKSFMKINRSHQLGYIIFVGSLYKMWRNCIVLCPCWNPASSTSFYYSNFLLDEILEKSWFFWDNYGSLFLETRTTRVFS